MNRRFEVSYRLTNFAQLKRIVLPRVKGKMRFKLAEEVKMRVDVINRQSDFLPPVVVFPEGIFVQLSVMRENGE